MAEETSPALALKPIKGVRVGCAFAGLTEPGRNDVVLISFGEQVPCAAVFTTNVIQAAPILLAREHLETTSSHCRGWLINAGNANCGTGEAGLAAARSSCLAAAEELGCELAQVLPFSTGVIMEPLHGPRLAQAAKQAAKASVPDGWEEAARAIMTTDTVPKGTSKSVELAAGDCTITGIAKGAGMIHPKMATMLAFIATDACATGTQLDAILRAAIAESFNAISIDGDTSTNDAVMLAAAGGSGQLSEADEQELADAVRDACASLALEILHDGEGCRRFATVIARDFGSDGSSRLVAEAVACSPLVKAMLGAGDPNIGRLLMAIGKSGASFDPAGIKILIGGLVAYADGFRAPAFSEQQARDMFAVRHIVIEVAGGIHGGSYTCHFADLTEEYVRINSSYRS